MNLALSLLSAAERAPEADALAGVTTRLTYAELRVARRGSPAASRPGRRAGRRVACILATRGDRRALLGLPVARRVRRAAVASHLGERSRVLHRRLRAEIVIRDPARCRAAGGRRAPRRVRSRRARALDTALHLGHDRATEGRPAIAARRACRRDLAGAAPRATPGSSHARRDAALPHDGNPLAARRLGRRRLFRCRSTRGIRSRRSC